jgi:hypothetical protein
MKVMSRFPRVAATLFAAFAAAAARAQELQPPQEPPPSPPPASSSTAPSQEAAPAASSSELSKWGFDLSVFAINPPGHDPYTSATLKADRDWLHLEGRWNYEGFHTGSLFVGANFEWEDPVELTVTPMIGAVAGEVDGVAPGFELDARWKWLEFYDETEYVVSTNDHHDNFVYSWAELTVAPVDWLRTGLVAQRTNAYDTRLSVDRGLLLSLAFKKATGTIYWFNPDKSDSYWMLTISFSI